MKLKDIDVGNLRFEIRLQTNGIKRTQENNGKPPSKLSNDVENVCVYVCARVLALANDITL